MHVLGIYNFYMKKNNLIAVFMLFLIKNFEKFSLNFLKDFYLVFAALIITGLQKKNLFSGIYSNNSF